MKSKSSPLNSYVFSSSEKDRNSTNYRPLNSFVMSSERGKSTSKRKTPMDHVNLEQVLNKLLPFEIKYMEKDHKNLPKNFEPQTKEWKHLMTPSENQGTCGSCWAFSSAGCLSDRINILSRKKILSKSLSPLTLILCNDITSILLEEHQNLVETISNPFSINLTSVTTQACYGNSTNYSTNKSYFSALKGRTWWGTTPLSEGPASTQEECENMCANSDKCSGATFNPVKRYCWTRSGDSNISTGQDDDYALISQQKEALSLMQSLNDKLLDLNNKITTELSIINPQVKQQQIDKNLKQQQLTESYQELLNQKNVIDAHLQEYYSVEQDDMNQSLYTISQNISLRFWVLITCLILLVTIKQFFGSENPQLSVTIWLLIIIVLIILTYTLNTPIGFMMWFLLLVAIILMKSGNLPSI
jgi:hypothetical protein